jgi:methyl-accepting chemotaxis protein-1 (serine sensor receptor)
MKISTRLLILGGMMSALVIAVIGLGLLGMELTNRSLQSVYEDRTVPAGQLGEIEARILENRLAIASAIANPTPQVIAASTAAVDANIAAINETWAALMATRLTEEEKKLAETFVADRTRFVQEGLKPTVAALRANNIPEARRLVAEKIEPLHAPVKQSIKALIQLQYHEAKMAYTDAEYRYTVILVLSLAIFAVGMVTSGAYNYFLIRGLGRQLGAEPAEAAHIATAVGQGDLSVRIKLKPGDTSSLMAQLKFMQDSLTQVVSNVRRGSETVSSASTEIASGNHDLSGRTESQVHALEQTAATMEQLNATVRQNADSAQQANTLAQSASNVAVKGGEVVSQVVDTMKDINESSKKIADIISVIDGIAFQTNILALNAAVEAARAGEQGRGFAVVAGEVRSLAGRSAEAAKEIKNLISASVERVEQGTALVDQAGSTMNDVVSSIRRVTDIMAEISTASGEQAAGVSQVGAAVKQMDQATQQNASLVEQIAATADNLRAQARDLVHTVAVFKLAPDQVGGASPTTQPQVTKPAPVTAISAPAPTVKTLAAPAAPQRAAAQGSGKADAGDWESF